MVLDGGTETLADPAVETVPIKGLLTNQYAQYAGWWTEALLPGTTEFGSSSGGSFSSLTTEGNKTPGST